MSVKEIDNDLSAKSPIKVGFLGYGTRALDALMEAPDYDVIFFIAPKARLCEDVDIARAKYPDIPFHIVNDNKELKNVLTQYPDIECVVMNACNIILNQDILDVVPVYNIHPGDMMTNRGHQPHMWSILLGEESSSIVIHLVTPGIDEGEIIGECVEKITPEMTDLDLLNLLEDDIPKLLISLYEHIRFKRGALKRAYGGLYRHVMTYEDYEVCLLDIDKPSFKDDMLRKIRSRSSKHGAFVSWEGNRIYFDCLLDELIIDEGNQRDETLPLVSVIDDKVLLVGQNVRYTLGLNKIEADK